MAQAYRACEFEARELRAEDVVPLQVGAAFGAGDGDVTERREEDGRLRYGPARLLERRHQYRLELNEELSPVAAVHVCEHAGVSGGAEGRLRAEGGRTLLVGVPAAELEDLRLQQGDRRPSAWQLALKLKEDVFDNRLSATHAEAQEASGRAVCGGWTAAGGGPSGSAPGPETGWCF